MKSTGISTFRFTVYYLCGVGNVLYESEFQNVHQRSNERGLIMASKGTGRRSESGNKGIDRRSFLKSAGLGAIGLGAANTLMACSQDSGTENTAGNSSGSSAVDGSSGIASWRTAPDPIPENEIIESHSTDVVVIGAGHAGIAAARELTEQGRSVVLLDKFAEGNHTALGNAAGCLNSTYLLNKGVDPIDPIEFFNNWQLNTNNSSQPTLIMKYAQNSGEAVDWFIVEMASDEEMATTSVQYWPRDSETRSKMMDNIGPFKFWSSSIDLYGTLTMTDIHNRNIERIKELGGGYFPGTTGCYLIQDDEGGITGVVAKSEEGYLRFDCTAVVIATGGFGGNEEMRKDLLSDLYYELCDGDMISTTMNMDSDGSGIAMAYWAGAKIEESRTIATMDGRTPWIGGTPGLSLAIGHPQGIFLNEKGRRFENEFWGPIESRHRSVLVQNRDRFYCVYDSNLPDYMESVVPSHGATDPTPEGLQSTRDAMEAAVAAGSAGYSSMSSGPMGESEILFWYGAETLEEAVSYLDADDKVKQNILDSVERYNGFVEAGADQEFGRDPAVLFPIKDGPFFVQVVDKNSSIGNLMVTMGGLIVDGDQQVLGGDAWRPIKGLFASGNCTGGRFGDDYFSPIFGVSLGIAITLGRECGRSVLQFLDGEL